MARELLCVDDSGLWLTNRDTPSNSTLIGAFPSGLTSSRGLTSHNGELVCIRISPSGLWLIDRDTPSNSTLIGAFPGGLTLPQGLTSHNGELLCADLGDDELWLIDRDTPSNSTLIGAFPGGLTSPSGLTSHNGELVCSDLGGRELWLINRDTPSSSTLTGAFPSALLSPRGLTSHNGELLCVDDSGDELWLIDRDTPSNSTLIGAFPGGLTLPQGVASHGDLDPIELEGQTLTAEATISQADLVIGTPDAVELEGQTLTAAATFSQAEFDDGYADVTLTDSSVVKNNAGRVTINDSSVEAQIPAEWLSATGAQYLVRVQVIGGSGQIRVYLDADPTSTGALSGPNLDEISLAGLRLTLTSPAGSVTVSGFDSDANEPYIFTPSDVAGVQAWANAVTTGDSCSARVFYIPPAIPDAVELEGQDLSAVATISQADLVIGTPDAVELEGQDLTAIATISEAALTVGEVPSVELEGQTLSAVATISQADLVIGTPDTVELEGQTLTAEATISEAALNVGTVASVELEGQTLTAEATISQAELNVGMAGDITLRGQALTAEATVSRATLNVGTVASVELEGQDLTAVATISQAELSAVLPVELEGQTLTAEATISEATLEVGTVTPDAVELEGQDLTAVATISRASLFVGAAPGASEAPTLLNIFEFGFDFVFLEWNTPDNVGDSPIIRYEVAIDSGLWISTGTTANLYRIPGLSPGTSYRVVVRAVTAFGNGAVSRSLQFTTLSVVSPSMPEFFSLHQTGERSSELRWKVPRNNGGDAITDYEVCIDGKWESIGSAETRYTVRGLAFDQTYSTRVRGVNSAGAGQASPILLAIPVRKIVIVPVAGGRIPLLDTDRQSVILRLSDQDCRLRLWWQPYDSAWYASLEIPTGTVHVQSVRLASGSSLLERVVNPLAGDLTVRKLAPNAGEPMRNAWDNTHELLWTG